MATTKKVPAKKAAKPKSPDKTIAPAWNTIHIFGYGESQVIGKDINGKAANEYLKNVDPVITYLQGVQGKGTSISLETLHALNIFNNAFIDFLPKAGKNKSQRFAWSDLDAKQINKLGAKLADEIKNKIPDPEARKRNNEEFKKLILMPTKKTAIKKTHDKKVGAVKSVAKKIVRK